MGRGKEIAGYLDIPHPRYPGRRILRATGNGTRLAGLCVAQNGGWTRDKDTMAVAENCPGRIRRGSLYPVFLSHGSSVASSAHSGIKWIDFHDPPTTLMRVAVLR